MEELLGRGIRLTDDRAQAAAWRGMARANDMVIALGPDRASAPRRSQAYAAPGQDPWPTDSAVGEASAPRSYRPQRDG
jgi:hypothetical protein